MNCVVCKNNKSKYKCPKCRIPYCSLNCWKTHSSQPCDKYEGKQPLKESTLENYRYKTEDTVPLETLKLLEQSEGVRATLHNPHVRSILDIIDKSDNPVTALKSAMVEPIFVEFAEECLKVIEPGLRLRDGHPPASPQPFWWSQRVFSWSVFTSSIIFTDDSVPRKYMTDLPVTFTDESMKYILRLLTLVINSNGREAHNLARPAGAWL